jgi:WD40 repeat protein
MDGHDPQDGEISFIGYGNEDQTVVTCAWDRYVKIHHDQQKSPSDSSGSKYLSPNNLTLGVLRGKKNCHRKNIISGDYAHNLGLIATGSRDHTVRVWDYDRLKLIDEINTHKAEVVIVKFLRPFPLLVTADANGYLFLWLTKPHPDFKKCVV